MYVLDIETSNNTPNKYTLSGSCQSLMTSYYRQTGIVCEQTLSKCLKFAPNYKLEQQ